MADQRSADEWLRTNKRDIEDMLRIFKNDRNEFEAVVKFYKRERQTLEKIVNYFKSNGELLKKMGDHFVQKGGGSYQGAGRLEWKGLQQPTREITKVMEEGGFKFRRFTATFPSGHVAVLELDQSFFSELGGDIDNNEELDAFLTKQVDLGRIAGYCRTQFERGEPMVYWYISASNKGQSIAALGTRKLP